MTQPLKEPGMVPEGYYPIRLIEELLDGNKVRWFAEHPDLPGCHALGDSQPEAMAKLEEMREVWLAWAIEQGVRFAPPLPDQLVTIRYADRPNNGTTQQTDFETETVQEKILVA